jgi:hypothetical protein
MCVMSDIGWIIDMSLGAWVVACILLIFLHEERPSFTPVQECLAPGSNSIESVANFKQNLLMVDVFQGRLSSGT